MYQMYKYIYTCLYRNYSLKESLLHRVGFHPLPKRLTSIMVKSLDCRRGDRSKAKKQ